MRSSTLAEPTERLPASAEPLPLGEKARLVVEILAAYGYVRWRMWRSREVADLVAALRARSTDRPPVLDAYMLRHLRNGVVRTLDKLPTDSPCLTRSLVLLGVLARRGVDTTLVIGVRTEPEFAAHAWVEEDGIAILPPGYGEYTPLTTI